MSKKLVERLRRWVVIRGQDEVWPEDGAEICKDAHDAADALEASLAREERLREVLRRCEGFRAYMQPETRAMFDAALGESKS